MALVAFVTSMITTPAQAVPTRWNLLLIPVDFAEDPGYVPPGADTLIVEGLKSYFYHESNHTFQLNVTWVPQVMRLAHERNRYNWCFLPEAQCLNMWKSEPGLPTEMAKDAGYIEQIDEGLVPPGGSAADVFNMIMFIQAVPTPDCTYSYPIMPGNSTPGASVSADTSSSRHRYVVGYAALGTSGDCVVDDSDVGTIAHEVGHGIANSWAHPACYISRFNLMDSGSGWRTSMGVFDRMDESFLSSGDQRWFNGWLPASNVSSLSPPESSTEVLSPLEWDAGDAVSPQGLKVDTGRGYYYLVECRRFLYPDTEIPTEGTLIIKVTPPGRNEPTCRVGDDPLSNTWLMTAPGYSPGLPDHWLSMFSPNDSFVDDVADLKIHVEPDSGQGCVVNVIYGPRATDTVPDLGILPWLTPPQNTWETTDLWIDSSCNGYVEDAPGDASRLQYGAWADGTAIGNGDDPCIAHENRVYARIRNFGTGVSTAVMAHFEVTDPLGVGLRDSTDWLPIDDVSVPPIAAGGFADVYVPWMPNTDSGDEGDRFALHSCIRVRIDAALGEIVLANQDGDREQENIDYFQLRRDPLSFMYAPASGEIYLANPDKAAARDFDIGINSDLPDTWSLQVGDGSESYHLAAGEVRHIPVTIEVPFGEPLGQRYDVRVRAFTTYAPPPGLPQGNLDNHLVSGLTLRASTVEDVSIGLDAVAANSTIYVAGCLSAWLQNQSLTIDYLTPSGVAIPQLVTTDAAGCFQGALKGYTGLWGVRAIWAGDTSHSRAQSDQLTVGVNTTLSNCCTVPVVNTPGCEYPSVESCVCASDPYCCNTAWDSICVGEVSSLGCGTCRDACTSGSDTGAFQQSTETCVCTGDAYCCATAWDSLCVDEVSWFGCGGCAAGATGPSGGGAALMTESRSTRLESSSSSVEASSSSSVEAVSR